MTSPSIFTLSEFTQLVSTALEIDSNLDTKLAIPIQIQTISAKSPSSLPPTAKSPRVLRKIKSLLAGRNHPTTIQSSASESSSSSIPTLSLEINSDPSLFVPYLSLADRHERFGGPHATSGSASIFSRGPGSCKLPTPPTSPKVQQQGKVQVHRRVSSTSSFSFALSTTRSLKSASTSSTSHGQRESTTESSLNDLDPFAKGLVQVVARRTSVGSSIFPVPVPVPASPARAVRRRRTSSLTATGGPKPKRHGLPPPRYNPPVAPLPPLPPNRQSSIASNSSSSSSSSSTSRSNSSLLPRSKQKALPPRRNPPTGPLPALPVPIPCSVGDRDRGLPSPPVTPPTSFRDSSSLSNRPDRDSSSSSSSWRKGYMQDWTLEMPYTSEEEKELGMKKNRGLSRSNEVSRKRSGRPIVKDTTSHRPPPLQHKVFSSSTAFLLEKRRDLKPMGHKRTGSPFPLTLMLGIGAASRSTPNLGLSTCNEDSMGIPKNEGHKGLATSAPATVPAFFNSASPSLSSDSASEDSDSDPLMNVAREREMMMREPAGMSRLGKNGLPRPVIVKKEKERGDGNQCPCPWDEVDAAEEELDTITPIQSPRTPTAGQFALAQMRTPVPTSPTSSSNRPNVPLQSHRRERPRQRVPESVVVSYSPISPSFPSPNEMALATGPFAASGSSNDRNSSLISGSFSSRPGTGDSTSSTGSESTSSSYWSARSTLGDCRFGSFSDEVGH